MYRKSILVVTLAFLAIIFVFSLATCVSAALPETPGSSNASGNMVLVSEYGSIRVYRITDNSDTLTRNICYLALNTTNSNMDISCP